jgi:Phosphatidyl serine synthase
MNFFVMNAFLIMPKHFFPIGRLLLWFAFGNIGFREAWEDVKTWNTVERKHNPVEGRHRWLAAGIIITEALLSWKYRYGTGNLILDAYTPVYIWLPWVLVIVSSFFFWVYLRFFKENRTKKYIEPHELVDKTTTEGSSNKKAIAASDNNASKQKVDSKKKNK